MRFDIVTIFPEFFAGPLDYGIVRRARETGLIDVQVQDLRVFTKDRHRTVDDRPFGGGGGMGLKPEPLFEAGGGRWRRGWGMVWGTRGGGPSWMRERAWCSCLPQVNCLSRRRRGVTRDWNAS